MTFIIFLLILSALIVVHEAGHLLAAKWSGMRVDEFGVGFPPRLARLGRLKGTEFVLNWLPFGGYVKIFGESPDSAEQGQEGSFSSKSRLKQALVLAAGVFMNFLLAALLFAVVLKLGIESEAGFVQRGLLGALWHGLLTAGKVTGLTFAAVWGLIAGAFTGGADFSQVVGPVGLLGLVGEAKALGLSYVIYFAAVISVNLAVVNLIPLPALDGGRLLITLVEALRGERLSPKVLRGLNLASFALLLALIVLITVRDVSKLI